MNIYDYLDEMQVDLYLMSYDEIEDKYYKHCKNLAGEQQANSIKEINLNNYVQDLTNGLIKLLKTTQNNLSIAIHFEYDLDNNWESSFYICDDYNQLEDEDDWACVWTEAVECPALEKFCDLYLKDGFDSSDTALGSTLYLVARTVVSLIKACDKIESYIPLCVAFQDEDSIMRIHG